MRQEKMKNVLLLAIQQNHKLRRYIMKVKLHGSMVLALVAGLILILAGCECVEQQVKGETAPPKSPEAQVTAPGGKTAVPVTASVVGLNDIHFDFDKYNIREEDAAILKGDVPWFKNNAGKKVRIEGNCDERGTIEYNLVLGQKRADSTKNFLVKFGVDGNLIQPVTYGKEKPICQEHNEECWVKNRRAHFVLLP
jgi:peptidoglycan-associated lipoprotein